MNLILSPKAFADIESWIRQDSRHLKKIYRLVKETLRTPRQGMGKPEQLKYEKGEVWSRRVSMQHRMVYRILDDTIVIHSFHGHYVTDL
jgi:toxin YoeB